MQHRPPASHTPSTRIPSRSQAGPREITINDIPVVPLRCDLFVLRLRALADLRVFKAHALRPLKKSREMSVSESGKVYVFTTCVTLLVFTLLFSSFISCEEIPLHPDTVLAFSCLSLSY